MFTLRVEQARDAQLSLGQWERLLQVGSVGSVPHALHVHQLRTQSEDDGVERYAGTPARTEIPDVQTQSPVIPKNT